MANSIADIRREYESRGIRASDLAHDPFTQFNLWFAEAAESEQTDVNVMTLATASAEGIPSARIVLLKGVDHGFLFFTNYESRKGKELEENPRAALIFWWRLLNRQVRVEGLVEKVDPAESDRYFAGRPQGSRLSAVVSPQSQVIGSREELEEQVAGLEREYGEEIPRPATWGGYRVIPTAIEFWQGRPSRLLD